MHDPIYVLGWIGFTATVGCVVIAYQRKPIPGLLGAIVTMSLTVLGQAAHRYISADKVKNKKKAAKAAVEATAKKKRGKAEELSRAQKGAES